MNARNNMTVQRPARVGTELVARGATPSETERSELGTRQFSIGEEACACLGHERETRPPPIHEPMRNLKTSPRYIACGDDDEQTRIAPLMKKCPSLSEPQLII